MVKKSNLSKSVIALIICTLSIMLILFGSNQIVEGEDNVVSITFDVDIAHISSFMPSETLRGVSNETTTYNEGDKVTFPTFSTTINTYYSHSWVCNGVTIDPNNYTATEDVVIKIKWQPIEYKVYYNYITEEEKRQITNLIIYDSYSVEKQVRYYYPTRPYYKFIDWYSSPLFLEDEIEIYTDRYARGDKYIYAKWQAIEYGIDYHTDAINIDNPPSYSYETPTFELGTPAKEGHIFKGWFKNSNFTIPITKVTKGSYGKLDLYPKWELEKCNVTYILPDGNKEVVVAEYGKVAPKPSVKTSIFSVLKYSKSINNITGDTEIVVSKVSIWYIYVIALLIIGGVTTSIIVVKKNNEKKMHKLRLKYQSNLKNKKGNIK